MRIRLMFCLVFGAVLLASCSGDDDATPSPTATVLSPTATHEPTRSATATPTATAQPGGPLDQALANSDELRATRPLSQPTLFYAYKAGKHVTVLRRDVATGAETLILEYDEANEASHDNNYWDELIPSVALDPAARMLFYATDTALIAHDLESGGETTLVSSSVQDTGAFGRRTWTMASGKELGGGYTLAGMAVGPGNRALVQMGQYEGSTVASFTTDGAAGCVLDSNYGVYFQSDSVSWSNSGEAAFGGPDGESVGGLFVVSNEDPCFAHELAQGLKNGSSGFDGASWSPDGQWIVAPERKDYQSNEPLLLVSRDDSVHQTLVDGGVNRSPLFHPEGDVIYYGHADHLKSDGSAGTWALWSVDRASLQTRQLLTLPTGWSANPSGWTKDGYLILRMTYGCDFFASCGSRLAVVDPKNGELIYLSATRDFTNFLGFVP